MPSTAPSPTVDSIARELAVRLTEHFARTGWDAVADPGRDDAGRSIVEIRSAEPIGYGKSAPYRVACPVRDDDVDRQLEELMAWIARAGHHAEVSAEFTTRPELPDWCRTD